MTFFNIYHWRKKAIPFLISGLIISCSPLNPLGLASQEYTAIAELGKIANKSSVTLRGIVVNIAPFLDSGAYQLQDATGLVWVRTDKPLPKKGTSLSVKGELQYEAIFVGKQQLGESYLLETSQEPQSSAVSIDTVPNSPPKAPEVSPKSDRVPSTPIPSPTVPSVVVSPSPAPILPIQAETPIPSATPTIIPTSPLPSTPVQPKPSPVGESEKIQVINPVVPSPTKPNPSKPKAAFNPDDQFLPHKRLQKE